VSSYSITSAEENEITQGFDQNASLKQKSYFYLDRLTLLLQSYHNLNQPYLLEHRAAVSLLLAAIRRKKRVLVLALLAAIAHLDDQDSCEIAKALGEISPTVLQDILAEPNSPWLEQIPSAQIELLCSATNSFCSVAIAPEQVAMTLTSLLAEPNPLIQAMSLYLLQIVDFSLSRIRAAEIDNQHPLVQETISQIFKHHYSANLADFPKLEKIIYLFNSDFFQSLDHEMLIELGDRGYVKSFQAQEHISEAGDTCRELLLLIEGKVEIRIRRADQTEEISDLLPGKVLDELEVLTHTNLAGTITAKSSPTRVLAIPVDTFDDLIRSDRRLAIKVLELESNRLKSLVLP
ncbi:MAG: cyclic nucleotide-binding domain-containing protein, partial [Pseudanabaenaceae cyanobacterium bins.68]|nr:cyclic nucleotide-binding domain-containing protein [Pseudanabaenaceae cyanobacterium bins.68]